MWSCRMEWRPVRHVSIIISIRELASAGDHYVLPPPPPPRNSQSINKLLQIFFFFGLLHWKFFIYPLTPQSMKAIVTPFRAAHDIKNYFLKWHLQWGVCKLLLQKTVRKLCAIIWRELMGNRSTAIQYESSALTKGWEIRECNWIKYL